MSNQPTAVNTVWHYAPWSYLPKISTSGVLRRSNAGAPGEQPLLWFSANQFWDPTASKIFASNTVIRRLTFREQAESFGCIRFGLPFDDPRLLDWKRACGVAGTSTKARRELERVGVMLGARPSQWSAVDADIPLAELHLNVFLDNQWMEADSFCEMAEVWMSATGKVYP